MKVEVLTLFPELINAFADTSMVSRAVEKNIVSIEAVNIRDYTLDKHRRVDDYPFGGGVGMLMQVEPIDRALEAIGTENKKLVYMSPRGKILDEKKVCELAKVKELVVLCGHYEGVDQRVIDYFQMEEISIGDYILTGGETAAMVMLDSVIRMIPDVLGHENSATDESIYSGLLEHDQYTKPREYKGITVPEVLWSGNHKAIHLWQFENSLTNTKHRRPDLFSKYIAMQGENLTKEEKIVMEKVTKLL